MSRSPLMSARFFSRLAEVTAARLATAARGLDQAAARVEASAVAGQMLTEFAGCEIYVPLRHADRLRKRNAEIRQQYIRPGTDGALPRSADRAAQLAREHGLSVRRLRGILASAY